MSDEADSAQERAREEARREAELIGRVIQSEQRLSDYFTTIITKAVTDQLERRSALRLRVFGIIGVSLLTVAIPGIMAWVDGAIVRRTDEAMSIQFQTATADLERGFEEFLLRERQYTEFTSYLLYLSDRRAVQRSELTSARDRLRELAADPVNLERSELPLLLDVVVRLAVKHHDDATLNYLEAELGNWLTADRTSARLARYYGEKLLGNHFTSEAKREATRTRFQRHMDAAEEADQQAALLPLQGMVNGSGEVAVSFEPVRLQVREFTPSQKAVFIEETVRYSNPAFWDAPTQARTRRIAAAAGQLVIEHRDFYVDLLDSVAVQSALVDAAEAAANAGEAAFASALAGFRTAFNQEVAGSGDHALRAAVDELVRTDLRLWKDDPLIVEAIVDQNRDTGGLSDDEIQDLERRWQDEFESGAYEIIDEIMDRPISRFLQRQKRDSLGVYRELHVMDEVGLLVGFSDPNQDYWQGDEDKWNKTYRIGPEAIHIGNLIFDESALAWELEISLPVVDPQSGEVVGALTVGVDPSALDTPG